MTNWESILLHWWLLLLGGKHDQQAWFTQIFHLDNYGTHASAMKPIDVCIEWIQNGNLLLTATVCVHHYTNLTFVRPSVRACVRESGRSREAIRPVLKTFPFSGWLELDATQKSPLTQPAMAPALD